MTEVEKRLKQFVQGVSKSATNAVLKGHYESAEEFCNQHCVKAQLLIDCGYAPSTISYDPDLEDCYISDIVELFETGQIAFSAITNLCKEKLDLIDKCACENVSFSHHVSLYIGIGAVVQSEITTFAIINKGEANE